MDSRRRQKRNNNNALELWLLMFRLLLPLLLCCFVMQEMTTQKSVHAVIGVHGFQKWNSLPFSMMGLRNSAWSMRIRQKVMVTPMSPNNNDDDDDNHKNTLFFFSPSHRLSSSSSSSSLTNPSRMISRLWANNKNVTTSTASATSSSSNGKKQNNHDDEISFYNKSKAELRREAETLRAKAKEIMAEVIIMEQSLKEQSSKRRNQKQKEIDDIIFGTLFSPISYSQLPTTTTTTTTKGESIIPDTIVVADRLQKGRYSLEQILAVVDRLYELQARALGQPVTATTTSFIVEFQIGNVNNAARVVNETAYELCRDYLDVLIQAAQLLDASSVANSQQQQPSPTITDGRQIPITSTGRLEIALRTRLKELRRIQEFNMNRQMAAEISRAVTTFNSNNNNNKTGSIEEYMRQTLGIQQQGENENQQKSGSNSFNTATTGISDVVGTTTPTKTPAPTAFFPLWVPATLLPYIVNSDLSSVGSNEVETIKSKVLLGSRFYLTSLESIPGAALFRGNIRTSLGRVARASTTTTTDDDNCNNDEYNENTWTMFEDIQNRLQAAGLGDKIQLFLLSDPEAVPTTSGQGIRPGVAAVEPDAKPVILALPKNLSPDESIINKGRIRQIGKSLCYPLTALSILHYSISMYALNPTFFDSLVNRRDLTVLYTCIPLVLGTIAIQTIHEFAHYLVAKRKRLKIGLPVPIPSVHPTSLPFFGCITPLRSFPTNRTAILDFALSGPMSAIAASLCMVIGGVLLTTRASAFDISRFPVMSVANMKSSFLLGSILSWLAPKTMLLPLAQPIPMHPFFVIGASGLISSALNLLPIFRLDGGRACFAAMGQRQGAVISVFTMLLMISMAMSGGSSVFLIWTFLVALLQRRQEIPPRDDVTEVDGRRLLLWLLSFLLSLSILTPFPRIS